MDAFVGSVEAIQVIKPWIKMINCKFFTQVYFATPLNPAAAHILSHSLDKFDFPAKTELHK